MRRTGFYLVLALAVGLFALPISGYSMSTEFHGYMETRSIFRDTSGFQYGFADDEEVVQWTQELQMDLEVRPEYTKGQPQVRFEKAFFRYRGAYDAILDIRDQYNDIREKSPEDFELGRDDLKLENDLRECFADFIAENPSGDVRANLRMGRQIVQWGEADGFNLMNIINPNDNRSKMFFSNPEDLLTPLWMGRLDMSVPGGGIFEGINAQLLAIPDVRPTQYAPLDGDYNAPYAFAFKAFSPLSVKEDVPSSSVDNMEFGARLGTNMFGTALFLYYFEGYADNGALDFSTAATGAFTFRHPKQQTMGYSFSKFIETGNLVFRGEGSMTKDYTALDFEESTGRGYTFHDFYQVLFGIDKSLSNMPIGTDSAITSAVQVYYTKIDDYQENAMWGRNAPEEDYRATLLLATDYIHGTLSPTIFVMYDFENAWMTQVALNYCPDGHWYVNLTQMSFWGDPKCNSAFAPFITTASEVALKVGWRW